MRTENPYFICPTENVGYQITPFEKSLADELNELGCIWQLEPGTSTRVQLLTHPVYKVQAEAVNGIGYFLRQGSDDKLDIRLASPELEQSNPKIIVGKDDIVCFVASPDSRTVFAVEGTDLGIEFLPEFEREVFSGRDRMQIIIQGDRTRHLNKFWQAHHILRTQSLEFVRNTYPSIEVVHK